MPEFQSATLSLASVPSTSFVPRSAPVPVSSSVVPRSVVPRPRSTAMANEPFALATSREAFHQNAWLS